MLALARDAVLTHGSTFGLTAYITSRAVQVPHLKNIEIFLKFRFPIKLGCVTSRKIVYCWKVLFCIIAQQ
jgi:hypothetical protein